MTPIRLRLLGAPDLSRGDQPAVFKTRKAVALLAYLTVEQGSHPRELLADLLWPAADAEDARSSLRMTIRYVRIALGNAAETVLLATRDAIGLAPSAPLDLDVAVLSHACQQTRAPGAGPGLRDEVERAISLYRGPFLGEFSVPNAPEFDAWLAGQRAHWLGAVSELLDWLSTVQVEADDGGTTLQTLERWVSIDPVEEVAWQRLIELHLAQGNRLGARRAWSAYLQALAELGNEPSAQLETLGSQVAASLQPDRAAAYRTQRVPGAAVESPRPDESGLMEMPFVGRARELVQLRRVFERSRAGEPQVVVLEGESGIGKTRLADEFLAWAAIQGADVLRGGGFETTLDLPYASLVEALRSRLERENAPDDLLDDPWLAELSQLLPELRIRYRDLPPPTSDPALGRHQVFEAVTRLFKGLAGRRPLVLFHDDWHWSDTSSRDLMRYTLRRSSEDHDRVLVLLAVSAERFGTDRVLAQWMGGLERDAPTTRLGLERLTAPDIVLWVAALAGTEGEGSFTDAAAMRLGEWLIERALGNPSQIVTAFRTLLDQQVLTFRQCDDGSWMLDLTRLPQLSATVPVSVTENVTGASARHQDWGDAPDSRLLRGRRGELDQLERWVVTDRCREVAVLGIGGIGKTALTARLAHVVAPYFEFVFWRSLRNALPFDEWLIEAVRTLSEQQVKLPENQEARILLLLELLRTHRCLLVLDNLETVLQPRQREAAYLEGYALYGLVLQRVGEVQHQSCLLLTSREKPVEVGLLEGEALSVRTFQLSGLGADASRALLEHERLDGVDEDWQALVERYGGNPLALQLVAETIGDVFAGDIAAFLLEGEAVYGGIRRVLDGQFERLSPIEQALLFWLAIDREPLGFVELFGDLEPPVLRGDVLEALEGLRHRSLVEPGRQGGVFTLQPVVLEYVTNRLVSAAVREVRDGDLALLRAHALSKAQSKSYVRQMQERLIVVPILDRLMAAYGSSERMERRLLDLLEELRSQGGRDYAPANLVNLLHHLRSNLRGLDLSHLFIRQAYLQEVDARDGSLAGSHLSECALADAFDICNAVSFSPDGRYLAAGTFSGEVCVWQLADWTRVISTQGHKGRVYGLEWASDSHLLASGGADGTVKLWKVTQGVPASQLLATLEGYSGVVQQVCFSQDGHLIASSSLDGTVRLWETSTGRLLHILQGHKGAVWGVALSNDGSKVASAGTDGTVKLWDATSGSLLSTLEGHMGIAYDVALTRDGRLVAGGGQDGSIRLWEVATGHLVATLEGHTQLIRRLATSADGQLLVSGSQDGTVRLWDITQRVLGGVCLTTLEGHAGAVLDVAISPDARRVASTGIDGTIRLWEAPTGRPVTTLQGYARGAWSLDWDGTGMLLVNGAQDGTINLWDVAQGGVGSALRGRLHGHSGMVFGTALSEDGELLATGSFDYTIRIWRVADGLCLGTLQAHNGSVTGLALSPDARLLISGGLDGWIKLWDITQSVLGGEPLATTQAHTGVIWQIALGGDGHLLASASQDGTVKLWEIPSAQLLATIRDHDDLFWGVAVNRDGTLVASGGQSGRVTLWEAPSGRFLATLGAHEGQAWSMAFSRDERVLVSCGVDGTVMLWDVATRRLTARLTGHDGPVNDVAVSPDGSLIASSGQDGAVMLWDSESGARRATLRPDRQYERMDITGLTGVSEVQKTVLETLGAVERSPAVSSESGTRSLPLAYDAEVVRDHR
jgi:WD40 repeat protein/DNA-binding SARP family transcriptional activator